MADKSLLEQMLERLVNEDQAKAEELFHEYVVAKSREIYENLIDSELEEASEEDEDEDEEMDEAAKASKEEDDEDLDESAEEDDEDEDMDEGFEDIAIEGDDEMGGDPTDELEGEMGPEDGEEGEMSEKEPAELFQDLDAIVDELQAKFDAMGGDMGGDMGGEEDEMKDAFEPEMATVREYVEKVPAGHGAEKKGAGEGQYSGTGAHSDKVSVHAKSLIDNMKNDMGGTTANILSSKEEPDNNRVGAGKKIQGSALNDQNPKEENFGNVNVPGGNAGKTGFKHKEPGHGAEKKGGGEGQYSGTGSHSDSVNVNKQSLFRGRR